MTPNSMTVDEQQVAAVTDMSFTGHFWSCGRQGMDQLIQRIQTSYDTMESLYNLYKERARLELEFGQKLMELESKQSSLGQQRQEALMVIQQELKQSAKSHIDMSSRLEEQVAGELMIWIEKQRKRLDELRTRLEACYNRRQQKISALLKARTNPTAMTQAEQAVQEWNETWIKACEQLEQWEQDRIEFFVSNAWDYANLASARLLVQDEWCEIIRKHLEECSVEKEIQRCIQECGTGTKKPCVTDYLDHFAQENILNKRLPPRPRTISSSSQAEKKLPAAAAAVASTTVKRKPVDKSLGSLEELLKKFETTTNNEPKPPPPVSTTTTKMSTNRPLSSPKLPNKDTRPPLSEMANQSSSLSRKTLDLASKKEQVEDKPVAQCPSIPHQQSIKSYSPVIPQQPQPQPSSYSPVIPPQPQPQASSYSPAIPPQTQPQASSYSPVAAQPQAQPTSYSSMHPQNYSPVTQQQLPAPVSPVQQYNNAGWYPSEDPGQRNDTMTYQQPQQQQPPRSPRPQALHINHNNNNNNNSYAAPRSPVMMSSSPSPIMHPASSSSPYLPPTHSAAPSPRPITPPPPPFMEWQRQLPDGRIVLFWVRAKYDYLANDETEISFKRGSLFAVTGESEDKGWWIAELWDETWQCSVGSGCIPSNYMMPA